MPTIPLIDRLVDSHGLSRRPAEDGVVAVGIGEMISVGAGPANTFTSQLDAEKVTFPAA